MNTPAIKSAEGRCFRYSALRYLIMWEQDERNLHDGMNKTKPSISALRESLKHFRIARNFKGVHKDETAEQIRDAVSMIGADPELSPIAKVTALAEQFKTDHFQRNISAASKLLWLRYRHPFVIYDGQAVCALQGKPFSLVLKKGDYGAFWRKWHEAYEGCQDEIKEAAIQLTVVQPFFTAWHKTDASLLSLAHSPWFLERVFDKYLWDLGKARSQ